MNIWPEIIQHDFIYIEVGVGDENIFTLPVQIYVGANKTCVLSVWKFTGADSEGNPNFDKVCDDQMLLNPVLELKL